MKRILVGIILILVCALPVAAQDHTADVAQAKADLERAGVPLNKQCGAAKIANLVAWRLRPQYGLLGKNGGNRAVLRADGSCENGGGPGDTTQERGVATDYLIDVTTKFGFDLLGDSGTDNTPHWQGPETAFVDRNTRDFTLPIDPAVYMGALTPPVVGPPPVGVPPSVPPPAPLFDLAALQQQIAEMAAVLNEHVRADGDAHASIAQNITDGRNENRSFFSAVGQHWKSITAIVAPAVTYWTCHSTGKC
jgi:hypothetical protein